MKPDLFIPGWAHSFRTHFLPRHASGDLGTFHKYKLSSCMLCLCYTLDYIILLLQISLSFDSQGKTSEEWFASGDPGKSWVCSMKLSSDSHFLELITHSSYLLKLSEEKKSLPFSVIGFELALHKKKTPFSSTFYLSRCWGFVLFLADLNIKLT